MRIVLCLLAFLPACLGPGGDPVSEERRFAYVLLSESEELAKRTADPAEADDLRDLLKAHQDWLGALTETRLLLAAGPVSSASGSDRAPRARGLLLLDLETEELVDGVTSRNPAIESGLFEVEIGLFDAPRTLRRAPFLDLVARSLDGEQSSLRPEATAIDYYVVLGAGALPLPTGIDDVSVRPVLEARLGDGRPVLLIDATELDTLVEQVGARAEVLIWRTTKGLRAIAVEPRPIG